MAGGAFPEVLESITQLRVALQDRLSGIDRYRAIQAIEKTMAEFPELKELTQSLSEIRERMQRHLHETREYRAILSVEKIMPELATVLDVLAGTAADPVDADMWRNPPPPVRTDIAEPPADALHAPTVAASPDTEVKAKPAEVEAGRHQDAPEWYGGREEGGMPSPGFAVAGSRREEIGDGTADAPDYSARPASVPPDDATPAALSLAEFLGPSGADGDTREDTPGQPPGGERDDPSELRAAPEGRAA